MGGSFAHQNRLRHLDDHWSGSGIVLTLGIPALISAVAAATNRLSNGDFSSNPGGWSFNGDASILNAALRLVESADAEGNGIAASAQHVLSPAITAGSSVTITLSTAISRPSAVRVTIGNYQMFFNAGNNQTATFTSSVSATTILIEATGEYAAANGGSVVYTVDDVSVFA